MRGNGLIRLDRTIAIEAKLDAVMNKLSSNEKRMHTAHEVGAVREGEIVLRGMRKKSPTKLRKQSV